jgi:3-oxoacyl-(acyl-carrier-protein) synthase
MTAPNPAGVERCIRAALADAELGPDAVDVIDGHLTATGADPREVHAWARALGRPPERFPAVTATKSLIGHALGAAGGIECAASVLMAQGGFVHASRNCEDVHPEIAAFAGAIAHETTALPGLRTVAKAGFGFGDVNAVVVFGRHPA